MSPRERLAAGIAQLRLEMDDAAQDQLLEYLELLQRWNRVHNLTAVRDADDIVTLHLLDSLAVLPYLGEIEQLIDIGSGAGLPGIPLAIAREQLQVTLLDSSHKRVAFMRQAKAELGLANVNVVAARAEEYAPAEKFDAAISRAFGDLADFAQAARHLVKKQGRLLAMKGVYPYEEIAALPKEVSVPDVIELALPFTRAKRHLAIMAVDRG